MTNREWLMEQMQNMSDEELGKSLDCICTVINKPIQECTSDCKDCLTSWLKAEHKEKIKLSEAERVILENIDKKYKWIARDFMNGLHLYSNKPKKTKDYWEWEGCLGLMGGLDNLFQFIKWSDSEPYEIAELLKGE